MFSYRQTHNHITSARRSVRSEDYYIFMIWRTAAAFITTTAVVLQPDTKLKMELPLRTEARSQYDLCAIADPIYKK